VKAKRSRCIAILFLEPRPQIRVRGKCDVPSVSLVGDSPCTSWRGDCVGRSGRVRKIFYPQGMEIRTYQHVASRYTDWVIPATTWMVEDLNSILGAICVCVYTPTPTQWASSYHSLILNSFLFLNIARTNISYGQCGFHKCVYVLAFNVRSIYFI